MRKLGLTKTVKILGLFIALMSASLSRANEPVFNHSFSPYIKISRNVSDFTEKETLPSGNWFDAHNGDWVLSIFKEKVIYDSKVWSYQYTSNGSKKTLLLSKGRLTLPLPYSYRNGQLIIGVKSHKKVLSKAASYTTALAPTDPPAFNGSLFKMDTAVVTGYLFSDSSRTKPGSFTVFFNNTLAGEQQSQLIKADGNGEFSAKIPISYPTLCWTMEQRPAKFLLTPGGETFVLFDLTSNNSPLFMGSNCRISSDLSQDHLDPKTFDYFDIRSYALQGSALGFKEYCLQIQRMSLKALDSIYSTGKASRRYYQWMKLNIAAETARNILYYHFTYARSSDQKSNVANGQNTSSVGVIDSAFYDFITDDLLNNEIAVITFWYDYLLYELERIILFKSNEEYITLTSLLAIKDKLSEGDALFLTDLEAVMSETSTRFFKENGDALFDLQMANQDLLDQWRKKTDSKPAGSFWEYLKTNKPGLSSEQKILLDKVLLHLSSKENSNESRFLLENRFKIDELNSKYASELKVISAIRRSEIGDSVMRFQLGIHPTFCADILFARYIVRGISMEMTPLKEETLNYATDRIKNPFISDYVRSVNGAITKRNAALKDTPGYVKQEESTSGELIFGKIIEPFKGKVILVDFWATWCGPCRIDMNLHKSMKDDLIREYEGVVFVYITNHTSPKSTYVDLIPTIPGEHFRVDADQWSYLSKKFRMSGIPHYVLVDKNGQIVNSNAPRDVFILKNQINKLLNEEKNID